MVFTTQMSSLAPPTCEPWCNDNPEWVDYIVEIFLWFLAAITVFGNILVLVVFAKDRELCSNISNLYILNLFMADLLIGMFVIPINNLYRSACYWPYSASVCRFWSVIDYAACTVSVWAVLLISYDRLVLVTKGLEYEKYQTVKKFVFVSVTLWLVLFGTYIYIFVLYEWWVVEDPKVNYEWECYGEVAATPWFVVFDMVITNTVPIVVIALFNARLYINILQRSKGLKSTAKKERTYKVDKKAGSEGGVIIADKISTDAISGTITTSGGDGETTIFPKKPRPQLRRHRKAAVTLAVLVGVACLCWMLYFMITFLSAYFGVVFSTRVLMISYFIFYSNSGINPFLYVATNRRIRAGIIKILKCDWRY